MKLMQMVSSQEKVHYVLAVAAGGFPVSLLSDALHYQSATKLACKLETNLLNNVFLTFSFLKLLVIHFAYDSPLPLVKCFGHKISIYDYGYVKAIKLQSAEQSLYNICIIKINTG